MRFESLLELTPVKVKRKCIKLDLYQLVALVKDGVMLYPKMHEAIENNIKSYRPTKEELKAAMVIGCLLKLSQKAFEQEQEAAKSDSRRWIKLIRSDESTWEKVRSIVLQVLNFAVERYEQGCELASLEINGHPNWRESPSDIMVRASKMMVESPMPPLPDCFLEDDFQPLSLAQRYGVWSGKQSKWTNSAEYDLTSFHAIECEWARRRVVEKYDLPPSNSEEPLWELTDDDLIQEMAVFCTEYAQHCNHKK